MSDQLPTIEGDGGPRESIPVTLFGDLASGGNPIGISNPIPASTPDGFFALAASFVRPSNTTAYASGDLVADSTSAAAALELPLAFRAAGQAVRIERLRLRKTSVTLTDASLRVHLFRLRPTLTVNDNDVFDSAGVLAISDIAGYVGTIDVTMNYAAVAGACGVGVPGVGSAITCDGIGTSLWVAIEARAAYGPASAETFTVTIEGARS